MKKILGITLAAILILTLMLLSAGCTTTLSSTPPPSATQVVIPSTTPTKSNPEPTQVPYQNLVIDLVRNSATFKFDGIDGSLKFTNIIGSGEGSAPAKEWEFTVVYQTRHPGHGDRTGQILAQVITDHSAVAKVKDGEIVSAVCDNSWDLLTDKHPTMSVSGIVVSSGENNPPGGPNDGPRMFTYKIQKEDSTFINVNYIVYPPLPAGDLTRSKVTLQFISGSIQIGDYLIAQGTYFQEINTIVAANQGDYIFTFLSEEKAQKIALDFVKNSSTFKFDGIADSIKFIKAEPGPTSAYLSMAVFFEFQARHPGHGDRTGQMLAQVITRHAAMVLVNIEKGAVTRAVCDNTWDMINEKDLPVTVSGVVINGGDTTPSGGPQDAPRKFVYQIQKSDGSLVNVTYTAYPPSPAGDAARSKITLDFYAGTVNIGDKMEAYGLLDKNTNTVTVANPGDYIRTFIPKLEVIGLLISGGDTTQPGGPMDAPRKFLYNLQKEDSTFVKVTYTAYPPSPAGDAARVKIGISYYDGEPKTGDYMRAYGRYDKNTNTVVVDGEGDYIKTYPMKP